ncbi:MAG: hypothetical protein HQ481_14565 [Alphaproteobacteria bacterium]|nr:hypothetical protein [Alphaproteobacteria bacterium]
MFDFPSFERAIGKVATRSALNPLLWLTAIFSVSSFVTVAYVGGDSVYFFGTLGSIPMFSVIFYFGKFAKSSPDRLQSEEYLTHIQRMQIMSQKNINSENPIEIIESTPASQNFVRPQDYQNLIKGDTVEGKK